MYSTYVVRTKKICFNLFQNYYETFKELSLKPFKTFILLTFFERLHKKSVKGHKDI